MVTKRVIVPARAGSEDSPATVPGALDPGAAISEVAGLPPLDHPTVPETGVPPDAEAPDGVPGPARIAAARAARPATAFWPLLLLALGGLVWMVFQMTVALNDRKALRDAHAQQQQTVDKSAQLRASLDALAADTQRMAEGGNPNARAVVEELRRRGVTINPAGNAPK